MVPRVLVDRRAGGAARAVEAVELLVDGIPLLASFFGEGVIDIRHELWNRAADGTYTLIDRINQRSDVWSYSAADSAALAAGTYEVRTRATTAESSPASVSPPLRFDIQ